MLGKCGVQQGGVYIWPEVLNQNLKVTGGGFVGGRADDMWQIKTQA